MKLVVLNILIFLLFPTLNSYEQTNFTIEAEHWKACETRENPCKNIIIKRKSINEKLQLIMPCGGTYTTVKLYRSNKENPIKSLSIGFEECPPIFDITQLKDGNYSINMMACSLGGEVKFTIITE